MRNPKVGERIAWDAHSSSCFENKLDKVLFNQCTGKILDIKNGMLLVRSDNGTPGYNNFVSAKLARRLIPKKRKCDCLEEYFKKLEAENAELKEQNEELNNELNLNLGLALSKLDVAVKVLEHVVTHEKSNLEINPDLHKRDSYRGNMYECVREALHKIQGEK